MTNAFFGRRAGSSIVLGGFLLIVASCAQEEYPAWLWDQQHPSSDASAPPPNNSVLSIECNQAHAQPLPARLVAMSGSVSSTSVVLESDLFQRFLPICGPCHGPAVDQGQGGFQITTAAEFQTLMDGKVLGHITAGVCPTTAKPGDDADPMPPCGSPNAAPSFMSRSAGDPVKQFADLVTIWVAAGSPSQFTVGGGGGTPSGDAGASNPFALSSVAGNAMTNLGNCIPSGIAMVNEKAMALDAMFAAAQAQPGGTAAQAIGLPEHLGDTDLFTLDSGTLAEYGVIAYAPGYPLWSDNAGKLRHVRVPRGTSIHFNKTTQQFEIPPNTRFYKTFMRQIVDTDGSYRYRKIETRLILSRPDVNNPDGTAQAQTALFGTYKWTDDESDAVLVETPLNNGQPFGDTLFLYNTDEPLAADLLTGKPQNADIFLVQNHAARHYAIPGSPRCIQCHMGSPSQDFVLGFTPLQINRRPTGVGGTIEGTGEDELSQLQRLVDAGLITGIDSSSDVLPLEQSQGTRTPRNNYELVAQGYLLGNCAHCHNPRGFPTVQNPVLQNVLNFLPSATDGGVFQFPLERYSPRIGRGLSGTTPIPYVTPSLVDLPRQNPKTGSPAADTFVGGQGAGKSTTADYSQVKWVVYAPWRSIVYRNVDSAFAYTDDIALYPHMPMNTPGYDPRAKQILSDWMVSIPAVRKHPELVEYAYQTSSGTDYSDHSASNVNSPVVDRTPQPYAEVSPDDPRYSSAVAAAQQRLEILHTGINPAVPLNSITRAIYSRYADTLADQTDDILDPNVVLSPECNPIPSRNVASPNNPYPLPLHPHWVVTDLTSPPGQWAPRQTNWQSVLVEQQPVLAPALQQCPNAPSGAQQAYQDQLDAVGLLQAATLDQVRQFASTPIPFGLWQTGSGCDFSKAPKAGSFQGAQRPQWMNATMPRDDAPVYLQSPGAAVFKMICINCHGPKADSNGRLAQNLATMTGGQALVANWHDGLFGPATMPESNIASVFSAGQLPGPGAGADGGFAGPGTNWTLPGASDAADVRAARYLAWMGLGGTSVNIPTELLEIVAVTKVLDQNRVVDASALSANMLSQAKALCLGLLGPGFTGEEDQVLNAAGYLKSPKIVNSLITANGDAEMWLRMCSVANPPPIHVLKNLHNGAPVVAPTVYQGSLDIYHYAPDMLIAPDKYPAGAPIGNASGGIETYQQPCQKDADCPAQEACDATTKTCGVNEWPWCVPAPAPAGMPACPDAVLQASTNCGMACSGKTACDTTMYPDALTTCIENEGASRWAVRGAINAGFAVFLYGQSIETSGPAPDYNQCNLLPSPVPPK
jgi:mono/diheme cytochrome c family protein